MTMPEQVTQAEVERLRGLLEKATPGPWERQSTEREGPDCGVCIIGLPLNGLIGAALPWPTELDSGDFSRVEANAELIVALVNAAPSLLSAADELSRMREALHEIDIEASNTIPPDGKDAAFAALGRIIKIINPFRRAALRPDRCPCGGELTEYRMCKRCGGDVQENRNG